MLFISTVLPKLLTPVTTNAVVPKLPTLALPVTLKLALFTKPAEFKVPTFAVPAIVTRLLVLLNVNPLLELALPASLNTTPVLGPGITMLPEIVPSTLPMKYGAVILPVAVSEPSMVVILFEALPPKPDTVITLIPLAVTVTSLSAATTTLLLPFLI